MKLYALVSSLTGTIQSNPLPKCVSFDTLVENFADFFHTKIKKIRDNLDHFPKYTPQHKDISILDRFHPMLSHEVLQITMNMPTKQCDLDPIPTLLFKQLVPHMIDDVTAIVNISLTRGDFTEEWKTACIKLLTKKITMELVSTSYRPVSNLKFLSIKWWNAACQASSMSTAHFTVFFHHTNVPTGQTTVVKSHYSN